MAMDGLKRKRERERRRGKEREEEEMESWRAATRPNAV